MSSRLTFRADSEAPASGPMRSLFLALAQAALASTLSAGCSSETPEPEETDSGRRVGDSGVDARTQRADAGSDAGSDAQTGPIDAGLELGSTAITCTEHRPELTPALKTTRPIEYVGVFRGAFNPGRWADAGPSTPEYSYEHTHQGEACSGVANLAACQAQLASLQMPPVCSTSPCPPYVVVQEGGQLSRLTTNAELLELIGVVDTPSEAVLLAVADLQVLCPQFSDDPDQGATIRALASGYEIRTAYELCGEGKFRDQLTVGADGKVSVLEHVKYAPSGCIIGRRPDGLHETSRGHCTSQLGAYLADNARLEAASVFAFAKLARELAAFGAPRALIEAAYEALCDEVRHTRSVGMLARAYGAEPTAPVVEKTPLRSLLALALDNISEGCVRETFGALLATYQAEAAQDADVRAAMHVIAEDETRHAALSWKMQAWLETKLTPPELAQVQEQRSAALVTLEAELAFMLPEADRSALGMPDAAASIELLKQLEQALPLSACAHAC